MTTSGRLQFVAAALLAAVSCGWVQAQVGRVNGSMSGTVTSADGAPVADAKIIVSGAGVADRVTGTDSAGTFSVADLPSGNYRLQATAAGFAPYSSDGIAVAIGRNMQLTVRLTLPGAKETVTVSSNASALDTSQSSSTTNIDRDRVEELPIPSRNYLTFTLLAPQVAPANPAIAQQTLSQGGGGFSFGGLRPGSNAVYIDGVDDDDEYSGSSRTQLSPEAISDFQIVNHGFAAESGGAAGGSIDVQTRSGADVQHGDAFLFAQNGALNGTPPLELAPYRPDESRLRAGLATGGAIKGGKTFYYLAAEQEMARGEDANDLSGTTIAQINQALRHAGPFQSFVLRSGFDPTTDQETELSTRVDRALTSTQSLMLRYAFTNSRNVHDAFNTDDLMDRSARGSSFTDDNSLNGSLSSTFSAGLLNRLNFEVAQRRAVERTGVPAGPGVLVPGVVQFGTPYAGNTRRFETHLEAEDGLLRQHGQHLFQIGASVDRVALRARNLDGFQGLYVFQSLAALASGNADFHTQSFGNPDTNLAEVRSMAYVQDHWTLTSSPARSLVVDYGLRYEDNRLPGALPQHAINFSPRLGIAYSPGSSWVVRSGFGIFYDRYQLATVNRLLEFDGTHAFMQTVAGTAAASLYQSGAESPQPSPGIAPSIWRAQPGMVNPYSEVASLGVERALPLGWTAKAEYQFVHGVRLGRSSNINLLPPVTLTAQNAGSLGISQPAPQQLGRPVFSAARIDPTHDAINQFATEANSNYNGATVTLNRQFNEEFELMAGYTYSKTIDDASYDMEQPQNPYALHAERALSLQDQRHRLTLSGLWVLGPDLDDPKDRAAGASPSRWLRAITGLEFAPILSVGSGFRANAITGVDSGLEQVYPFAARPLGFGRNALQTPANVNFDLRVLKMVPLWRGHLDIVAESFNLLNHPNVSLLNTAYGVNSAAQAGFGGPIAASNARQVQFSLDFEY